MLVVMLIFTLFTSSTAQAHSSVVKTTPNYKSTLNSLPDEISIRFSEEPLTIPGEVINSITVTNPNGRVISDSVTEISDKSLKVKITGAESINGSYGVRYRMASADGHVISGNYEFYLGQPSQKSAGNVADKREDQQWWGAHFLHLHRDHILFALAVLLLAIALLIWRRRADSR